MEVVRNINKIVKDPNSIVTVGVFDGVHIAHQEILRRMKEEKLKTGARTVLVTFDPHPQEVLHPNEKFYILTTIDERIELLSDYDLDIIFVVNFTPEFSNITAEEFCKEIMLGRIGLRKVIVGYNHAFGKNREGNPEKLKGFGEKYGFEVELIPQLLVENNPVSSSKIRSILNEGNVRLASKLLGRYYFINGVVVKGSGRGKELGIPTANIEPISLRKLMPKNGVYVVRVTIDRKHYFGLMNIGYRPTFELDSERVAEVNIFDFDEEIYFKHIKVEFIDRLRDEMKFPTPRELVEQIERDKKDAVKLIEKEFSVIF
ncbi:riboflavin kinase / FMN adenylyltransferase [Candidatus Kryptonium thompsonii]|uniref:Riboflavin biosynthesis protein n=1 Tax=Candidatus Kryptonium thompsonii TaxID=1633631 RepID=A0A0P1P2P9_9BACT|nr:bifunctional riboflavin kinase/FAD synthetase [Candidatus Kryptonium thompsoni]CUS80696.1 riboflavin kinase / FMN adenylyltransferase [Candidatus Kryptonium thompsoni]CUS81516.1 riboflavin kinase / FMN adenylyltransferase [Candidatus Kryptonium thompsoni]CUS81663.1 riboflavin kinase / FMN adenylyltransferase [Candidatus Kryptonium thompsoni]CUS83643.1 riboflavin kinase / FMN adenylyltransferase [Candidatus Kryptonium thompsoni]CUS97427.1 riboflavin kinase / FMN adenylyltransferase [Candidat